MWRLTFDGTDNKVTVVDGCNNTHTYTEVTSEDNVEFWKKQLIKAQDEIIEWHDKDTHWKAENMRLKRDFEAACAKVTELQRELERIKKDYKTACDEAVELKEVEINWRSVVACREREHERLQKKYRRIKEIIEEEDCDDHNM